MRHRINRLGSPILFFQTLGSTNDHALALAARGHHGVVVVAEEQTAGRGRRGRAWFSPPGSGLYVSTVLAPGGARVDPGRAVALVTLAAGVALAEAVEAAAGLRVDIKWPNDLMVSGRKIAGILAEGAAAATGQSENDARPQTVVLGYGINVGPMAYPRELAHRATSLETELGRRVDRAALFAESLASLSRRYEDLLDGRFDVILEAWRARAPGSRGARVTWQVAHGAQTGVTAGVDDRGALLVRVGDRLERVVAGELTWL